MIVYLCLMPINIDIKKVFQKFGITELNAMQLATQNAIGNGGDIILVSPTGSGKTLAFLLPALQRLSIDQNNVQLLILAPSRELAIQIEQVARMIGAGLRISAMYGGQSIRKDLFAFEGHPHVIIGTPGRIAQHIRDKVLDTAHIQYFIIDEYDKCLELGFTIEMEEIADSLPQNISKILTSATIIEQIPEYLSLRQTKTLLFKEEDKSQLSVNIISSQSKDKLDILVKLLLQLGNKNGIIFCNYKDTINFVSEHLNHHGIEHITFYGGMEQRDRERALIQFRNASYQLMIATDLAARGIDVPDMDFIIHYQTPLKEEEFIHRNGRTARMHSDGAAYVLKWEKENLKSFIKGEKIELQNTRGSRPKSIWTTLFISGGRKDKISKGDIAGLFFKQGNLEKDELGLIELKKDCAFIAVPQKKAKSLIDRLNNTRLKKKKVRITRL